DGTIVAPKPFAHQIAEYTNKELNRYLEENGRSREHNAYFHSQTKSTSTKSPLDFRPFPFTLSRSADRPHLPRLSRLRPKKNKTSKIYAEKSIPILR
ncbi:hypothetical protein AC578_10168, partial [Pseudocercospora eumusae]